MTQKAPLGTIITDWLKLEFQNVAHMDVRADRMDAVSSETQAQQGGSRTELSFA